jgi:hypothetical protein
MKLDTLLGGGNRLLWKAHEYLLDGGHEDWVDDAGDDYTMYLRLLGATSKPNLQEAPWRR